MSRQSLPYSRDTRVTIGITDEELSSGDTMKKGPPYQDGPFSLKLDILVCYACFPSTFRYSSYEATTDST